MTQKFELFIEGSNGGKSYSIPDDAPWRCYSVPAGKDITFGTPKGGLRISLDPANNHVQIEKARWGFKDGPVVGKVELIYSGPID